MRWRDGTRRALHFLQRQARQKEQEDRREKNKKHAPLWLYVATIVNRKTRAILAFDVVTERTWDTMQPLVDTVFSLVEQVHQFYSDGFSTYNELVYRQEKRVARHDVARHDVAPGKTQTYTIQGTNADLRCYGPALDRKGRCFPRHIEKFRAFIKLYVTCYNRCCLYRLKYPKRKANPSDFIPRLF